MSALACGRDVSQPVASPPAAANSTAPKPASAALKKLTLTYPKNAKLVAGAEVEASAEGLPPNRTIDLVWGTVSGGWVIEEYYRFRGKRFANTTRALAQVQVDPDGRVSIPFR